MSTMGFGHVLAILSPRGPGAAPGLDTEQELGVFARTPEEDDAAPPIPDDVHHL